MSTPPKPSLHLHASFLGPVATIDADLSKKNQNLVYARNGTGKSFLTRALRFLDLHGQGFDVSEAASHLVADEAANTRGSFKLSQGAAVLGALNLSKSPQQVSAANSDTIFHVFSDEFVHHELRERNYEVDGNIEKEITLDQSNIDTSDAEEKLLKASEEASRLLIQISEKLEEGKISDLNQKASVNRRLADYLDVNVDAVLSYVEQPEPPTPSFKSLLDDLDALKSIPAEPEYPANLGEFKLDFDTIEEINALIGQITSPSTVSEEIKSRLSHDSEFFETGLRILSESGDDACPFCKQSLVDRSARERIELYIAYFKDAEGRHKAHLRKAWSEINGYINEIQALAQRSARAVLQYEKLRAFVPSQRDVVLPDIGTACEAAVKWFAEYRDVITAKGKDPAATIALPDDGVGGRIVTLNNLVEQMNASITALNNAVLKADNERKSLQRQACRTFLKEFVHGNWILIAAWHSITSDVAKFAAALQELKKSEVSASVKERVADTFRVLIRSFFGTKYSFDPETFVLHRENKKMDRGASRTLSDGEKTAIAFCYFIACVHKKVSKIADYKKLFLVFDDPITSMSYDFVFTITQTLKNISISDAGSVSINPADIGKCPRPSILIFTHSSYFYNICVTNRVVSDDAAFFLHVVSGVHKLSRRSYYVAPFEQHLRQIYDVHIGGNPDHTTGNAIRSIIESIGRFCHPDKCDSLSNFVTFLAGDGGFEIKSVLINNLSHGSYYDESPSPDELREACAEAIAIVDRYAKGQLALVKANASVHHP